MRSTYEELPCFLSTRMVKNIGTDASVRIKSAGIILPFILARDYDVKKIVP